jgi:L-asparaginase
MINIFTTGGTFDKIYFDANSEFSIGDSQVEPILQEGNVTAAYSVSSILRKDSLDITDEDRQAICDCVSASDATQIIITHGTDTMTVTAAAIAATDSSDKTIVFIGAMQPARMRNSDAPFNVGFALAAVQLLPAGIYIAMNGQIFPYDQVIKNRQAECFESIKPL